MVVVVNGDKYTLDPKPSNYAQLYKAVGEIFGLPRSQFKLYLGADADMMEATSTPLPGDGQEPAISLVPKGGCIIDSFPFCIYLALILCCIRSSGTPAVSWDGSIACRYSLKDLQRRHANDNLPGSIESQLDAVPLASNYLIENVFEDEKLVGSVCEVYPHFNQSSTTLRRHLALRKATDDCALLISPAWCV